MELGYLYLQLVYSSLVVLMKHRYYRKQVEEAIKSSGKEPQEPDKVIEELREIRGELWRRGKDYFEA